jgi:hypothetical protein
VYQLSIKHVCTLTAFRIDQANRPRQFSAVHKLREQLAMLAGVGLFILAFDRWTTVRAKLDLRLLD